MVMREPVSLSESASRVLGHIRGRTRQAAFTFANQLWDMPDEQWTAALEEIRNAGYEIYWRYGTVADDPTVTGGWRLDVTQEDAVRLARIAQPRPVHEAVSNVGRPAVAVRHQRSSGAGGSGSVQRGGR
jgi:hypothetical protein